MMTTESLDGFRYAKGSRIQLIRFGVHEFSPNFAAASSRLQVRSLRWYRIVR